MSINVVHFSNFLDKTITGTNGNGIPVNEIKNLYNNVSFRGKLDYTMNNNYLVVMIELYCLCKNIDYQIQTIGGLKRLRGVTWVSNSVQEYAQIVSNGRPDKPDADERIAILYTSIYKDPIAVQN